MSSREPFHLHDLPHGAQVQLHREADNPPRDGHWLLAAAKPFITDGQTLADVGCGSGIIALCAAKLFPNSTVWAMDNDPTRVAATTENTLLNGLHNLHPMLADATNFTLGKPADHLLTNPPFYAETAGHKSQTELRQRARNLPEGLLEAWLSGCLRNLAPGGMIHMIVHTREQATVEKWAKQTGTTCTAIPVAETAKRVIFRLVA